MTGERCVASDDETTVRFSWSALSPEAARGVVQNYTIAWGVVGSTMETSVTVPAGGALTLTQLNIPASLRYYVRARATTNAGAGVWSDPALSVVPSE